MRNLYKIRLTIVVGLLFCAGHGMAQQKQDSPNPNATRTVLGPIQRLGVVDMRAPSEDWDPFFKTVQKIHTPGIDARKDRVMELKAEATKSTRP